MECPARSARCRPAFTLVELLSVVAILGLLISILLPSLHGARESARTTACRSNVRQLILASRVYAQDHRDELFPVHIEALPSVSALGGAWARRPGLEEGSVRPGLLYDYIANVDEVVECPSNWREPAEAADVELQPGMFGTLLDFDYTMVANTQGARLDRRIRMGHLSKPQAYDNWVLPPVHPTADEMIQPLSGLAVFVEEHTRFWNQQYLDGLWSNGDQLETRHRGGGHVGFIEGHVESFEPIMGPSDELQEPRDLDANDFYIRSGVQPWVRLSRSGGLRPYGWINHPAP